MNKRAAAIATAAAVGLALALPHPWASGPSRQRVYLPRVDQRLAPSPVDVPPPRQTFRPANAGALIDALTVPGALVLPKPGEYWLPVQARVASGVTLNGRGRTLAGGDPSASWSGSVTLAGHGLTVEDAAGVTLRGLAIRGVNGDGVTATRAVGLSLEHVALARASDGLLDLNGGSSVTMRDVLLHDGQPRGVLCGNWRRPHDGRERLDLERVTFRDVPVRTPKLQDCDLTARGLAIVRAREWGLDLRGSSTATVRRLAIVYGPKTNPPGWRADSGASVVIDGEVLP